MHAPLSATSSSELNSKHAERAQELYARFLQLPDKHNKSCVEQTDELARNLILANAITQEVKQVSKNILYPIRNKKEANPYPISNKKEANPYPIKEANPYPVSVVITGVSMDLPDIFEHLFVRVTFITLIVNQKFKLYLRKRIENTNKFEIYKVTQNPNSKFTRILSENLWKKFQTQPAPEPIVNARRLHSELNEGYLVFISYCETYRFDRKFPENPADQQQYYRYYPPIKESLESRQAPFHHEVQLENLCGLHALNAYIGCRYLTPEDINLFYDQWARDKSNGLSQTLPAFVLNCLAPSNLDSEKLNAQSINKPDKCLKLKVNGLPPTFLCSVLHSIAPMTKRPEIMVIETKTDTAGFQKMLQKLKNIDRFILGTSEKTEGHSLTFRRDDNGWWWRDDSERDEQEYFENDQDVLQNILDEEPNKMLYFIIPNGVVQFPELPPERREKLAPGGKSP
ncbi:MAG: hypothetical protein LLG04_11710 [Parachlamydia sp.]|nr:hypothetical protein [Parachlamydia sp.]